MKKKRERKKKMTLLIDNRTDFEITEEFEKLFNDVVKESLRYEEFDPECEVSLSIVSNDEIQEINKQFREIDAPTDVLSFPLLTFEEGEQADVNENNEIMLGDIIISIDKAKAQAEEYGHGLKRGAWPSLRHTVCSTLWVTTIWRRKNRRKCSKNRTIYLITLV